MKNYDYRAGLEILLNLGLIEMNLDQLERFKEGFDIIYTIKSGGNKQISYVKLLDITKNAYCNAVADKDKSLVYKLREEFIEKLKKNQFWVRIIAAEEVNNDLSTKLVISMN